MKNFSMFLTISLLILLGSNYSRGQLTQEWAKIYDGGSSDDPTFMLIDNSENIYVTGVSFGSGTGQDFLTIKYNSNGDLLWDKRYNGPANGNDQARHIAIDDLGNIYVTGFSAGIGAGTSNFTTIKYNTNGDSLWVRSYNGPGNSTDEAISVVIDALNNVYVTGYSGGTGTGNDYATLKYDASGSLQWVRRYNGPGNGNDRPKSIAIDSSENIYVTGFSAGVGTGTSDYATIKYNSLGDSLWVKRYNGSANGDDQANSLTIDTAANIYVTGYSARTGGYDYATIKYNSNGDSIWVRRNFGDIAPNYIRVDNSGNIYVGGSRGGNFSTYKYNPSGVLQWAQLYDYNNGTDRVEFLTLDSLGNIYLTGYGSAVNLFPDYLTIKYNSNGVLLWVQSLSGGINVGRCIAVYGLQKVYVIYSASGDYGTIKYSQRLTLNLKTLIEGFYNHISNKMIRDTARVYLRNANPPYAVVDSAKSYLDSNGHCLLSFLNAANSTPYYIVIKHRNSIETWSSSAMSFTSNSLTYDFTTAASQAYGNNIKQVDTSPLRFAIYSGDVTQDGVVDGADGALIDNDVFNFITGYVPTDVNGDNTVDGSDAAIVDNNAFNFVTKITPFGLEPETQFERIFQHMD